MSKLPMSFMAAFFAINIAQFPRDQRGSLSLGYVSAFICKDLPPFLFLSLFSHGFAVPIAAVITLPLVYLAFNVNKFEDGWESMVAAIKSKLKRKVKKLDGHPSA